MNKPKNATAIVLVGGCFDLLHYGHISFLTRAKSLGDYLIVLLESDESVKRLKGAGRPFHTQEQRRDMLLALSCVDEVEMLLPIHGEAAYRSVVAAIKPSRIAVTEGDPFLKEKTAQAEATGAQIAVLPNIQTPSTSQLAKLLQLE